MSHSLTYFYASVCSNLEIKKQQQRIEMVLEGKKIPYTAVDITATTADKERMRAIAQNPKALPPQFANGDQFCGGYEDFDNAIESETLEQFLKLN